MVYFISDVHLGLEPREKERIKEDILIKFLEMIKSDCTNLLIVGDFFDYWFEYKTVIPRDFFRIIGKLYELSNSGIKIEYVMGNHDFGHVNFFESELGIVVYKTDIQREWFGKKFYIAHGDGKSNKDTGYKILKVIMRNELMQRLFRLLHPDLGISLASGSSRRSRQHTKFKDYGESDGLKQFAYAKIDEGFDYVVMGHRHKVEVCSHGKGKYINLGDWLKSPTYLKFDGVEAQICRFP